MDSLDIAPDFTEDTDEDVTEVTGEGADGFALEF